VNIALLCAVVTFGAFALGTPQRAAACDCAAFTDTEAYEFHDVVFTGTLVEINTPAGDIVVSTDPERFVFDVDQVFKGEAQTRQSVVTAREGASCGLEISGPGPFVVFARLDDDGITRNAVEGEVYSNSCSGTRLLDDGALPTSFGTPCRASRWRSPAKRRRHPRPAPMGAQEMGSGSRRSSECSCSQSGTIRPIGGAAPSQGMSANRSGVTPGCAIGVCRWIYRRRWAPASRAATIAWERSSTQSFARMMLT